MKPTGFNSGLLLYAACAVAAWMAWPYIRQAFDGNTAPAYDEYGYRGDAGRRERWNQGGRGGYSDYYPGPRNQPASPPVARQQMRLDPTEMDPIEDRRGERGGSAGRLGPGPSWDEARSDAGPEMPRAGGRGLMCWDTVERHPVDPSFCDRERMGRR
jgi:hypothetical protein